MLFFITSKRKIRLLYSFVLCPSTRLVCCCVVSCVCRPKEQLTRYVDGNGVNFTSTVKYQTTFLLYVTSTHLIHHICVFAYLFLLFSSSFSLIILLFNIINLYERQTHIYIRNILLLIRKEKNLYCCLLLPLIF